MALIKTSPLVGALSGTIGGTNFVASSRGLVARPASGRVNPHTAAQINHQAVLANIEHLWRSLDSADRATWQTATASVYLTNRLGLRNRPSAFTLFCKTNLYLHSAGAAFVDACPATLINPAPTAVSWSFIGSPGWQVRPYGPGLAASGTYLIYAARSFKTFPAYPVNVIFGRPPAYVKGFRFMRKLSPWDAPFDQSIYDEAVAAFGAPVDQELLAVRCINVTSPGIWSAPFTSYAIFDAVI